MTCCNIIQCNTDGSQKLTVTLTEAADYLGANTIIYFDTDGGADVDVVTQGDDTMNIEGDTGNTKFAMTNSGEYIHVMAVEDDTWVIADKIGGTLT